jgi:hypothetical protein
VAHLIAADAGLDTSDYTFAYVAGWAASTGDADAALRAAGTRVPAAARRVLDAAHAQLAPAEPGASEQLATATDTLAARAEAGVARTAAAGDAVSAPPTPTGPPPARLLAATAAAADYFAGQYPASWAPAYLQHGSAPICSSSAPPARWPGSGTPRPAGRS